jgi:hypothetical protein
MKITAKWMMTAAAIAAASMGYAAPVKKQPAASPPAPPFAMRGVRLGITLDEFKSLSIPTDDGQIEPLAACSNGPMPNSDIRLEAILGSDEEAGVVNCQWFARRPSGTQSYERLWVDLGSGKGPPSFDFISDGTNYRLFRISFYANAQYYNGVMDALSRNYGAPKTLTSSFQTKSGAVFPNTTSVWSNSSSTIILDLRCRLVDRYCLTYEHSALGKIHSRSKERIDAARASKI